MLKWRLRGSPDFTSEMRLFSSSTLKETLAQSEETGQTSTWDSTGSGASPDSLHEPNRSFLHRSFVSGSCPSHDYYDGRKPNSSQGHHQTSEGLPEEQHHREGQYSGKAQELLQGSESCFERDESNQADEHVDQSQSYQPQEHYACPQNNKLVKPCDTHPVGDSRANVILSRRNSDPNDRRYIHVVDDAGDTDYASPRSIEVAIADVRDSLSHKGIDSNAFGNNTLSKRGHVSLTKYLFGTLTNNNINPTTGNSCHYASPRRRPRKYHTLPHIRPGKNFNGSTDRCLETTKHYYDTPKKHNETLTQHCEKHEATNRHNGSLWHKGMSSEHQNTTQEIYETPGQQDRSPKEPKETGKEESETLKQDNEMENHYQMPKQRRKMVKENETPKTFKGVKKKDKDTKISQLQTHEYESYDFKLHGSDSLMYALDFRDALGYHIAQELRKQSLQKEKKENRSQTDVKSVSETTNDVTPITDRNLEACGLNRNEKLRKSRSLLNVDEDGSRVEEQCHQPHSTAQPSYYNTFPRKRLRLRPPPHTSPLITSANLPDGVYVELFPHRVSHTFSTSFTYNLSYYCF